MKIILPAFVSAVLKAEMCELLETCDYVIIEDDGTLSNSPEGTEVLMLPWRLPDKTRHRLLALPTLNWIHSVSAGVEHALDDQLRSMDVTLTNARGVFDLPIAETVLAYILMIAKRMPKFAAQQRAHIWRKLKLREATDLTIGLVGSGSIGTEIARLCKPLNMRVIATRRHPERDAPHVDEVLAAAELDALLALQKGEIAGAALDVFAEEPLPSESLLWEMDNVIITPHNSWSTPHVQEREAALFLKNLRRYLRGEPLLNVVDKELGY